MARMLRAASQRTGDYGCCDSCARGTALHMKPRPRERHQARAIEKRRWKRSEQRDNF